MPTHEAADGTCLFHTDVGDGPPVLVVHGNADASAPIDVTGRSTAKLLPHGRFRLVEGAPHGLYVTAKSVLDGEIVAFARGDG